MAISKVILNTISQIDLTNDTVTAETLQYGKTAHDAAGNLVVGTGSTGTGGVVQDANGFLVLDDGARVPDITFEDLLTGRFPSGVVDISGMELVTGALYYRTGITQIFGTNVKLADKVWNYCTNLTSFNVRGCTRVGTDLFANNPNLVTAVFQASVDGSYSYFYGCSNLEAVDLNVPRLRTNYFYNDGKLATIILRNTSICTLEGTGVLNITHFKNGGTGGDIYIPQSLYDHLGDGTSLDYKAATNWTTVNGYGTITWHSIEGSSYEYNYVDGTPIPS